MELSAADKHCVQANQARSDDQDQAKDVHDVLRCKVWVDVVRDCQRERDVVVDHAQELPYVVDVL